ncbi:DUF488 family protein [Cetobacterium sp. ZOR0034]|uniref:DUF488 domain-containing protein n=1 Tax=Cetobacterium sp. ZOR0034 TaxID=1339239 RepID=UPI0006466A89|nr:DUF488 domain-containing protein [Cetobacterium sp. ZOR0034]
MEYKCYTIGYSGIKIERFIEILKERNINCVIDVRSTPYSKYVPEYNKEELKKSLKKNNIVYSNFNKEFGARRTEDEVYSEDEIVDFEKTLKLDIFNDGVKRLKIGYEKGYNIVLMCSEKNPLDCHRFSMVSKGLNNKRFKIIHILEDNKEISNENLEEEMVAKFFPNYMQINLFEKSRSYSELLKDAYRKTNEIVGYSRKKENIED